MHPPPTGDAAHARILAQLLLLEQKLNARQCPQRIEVADQAGLHRVAMGFGVLHAIYAAKLRSLAYALSYAITSREYLVYASAGRMIIEHLAILIYYGRDKIEPLLKRGNPIGITAAQAEVLGDVLDQFLSGRRHDWLAIAGPLLPAHLLEQRQPRQQVNILTCLKRWSRRDPEIDSLYSLFCDMVHPNVGSLLLFLHREEESLVVADPQRASVAEAIVAQTAPKLLEILEHGPDILDQLAQVARAASWAASLDGIGPAS